MILSSLPIDDMDTEGEGLGAGIGLSSGVLEPGLETCGVAVENIDGAKARLSEDLRIEA